MMGWAGDPASFNADQLARLGLMARGSPNI